MMYALPTDRMPEAEVSLRLAFYLLSRPDAEDKIDVGIDGAHIKVAGDEVFPISSFLADMGWRKSSKTGKGVWQGWYERAGQHLRILSVPGIGDIVAMVGGRRVLVECKGGPLVKKAGSPEYPRLRGALGQIITVEQVAPNDLLAVAVPRTERFSQLASKWRTAPLVQRAGIQILVVGRDGTVDGLEIDY